MNVIKTVTIQTQIFVMMNNVVVWVLGGASSSGTINGLLSGLETGGESFTSTSIESLLQNEDVSLFFI